MTDGQRLEVARALRASGTSAEEVMWRVLRGRQLDGMKFRRQHPFGPYVLDFYCPSARLAIEIDGEVHLNETQQMRDQDRDKYLSAGGVTVIRVSNDDVLSDLRSVLQRIRSSAGQPNSLDPPRPPSPARLERGLGGEVRPHA
jgi:very-short-patch-repair endonuclease